MSGWQSKKLVSAERWEGGTGPRGLILLHFKQGGSDKIWGYSIEQDRTALAFWGRTKGSLAFKHHKNIWDAGEVMRSKTAKGYVDIDDEDQITKLLPDDFEGQLMLARLGQVKFALS
jgi:hypothetical protein